MAGSVLPVELVLVTCIAFVMVKLQLSVSLTCWIFEGLTFVVPPFPEEMRESVQQWKVVRRAQEAKGKGRNKKSAGSLTESSEGPILSISIKSVLSQSAVLVRSSFFEHLETLVFSASLAILCLVLITLITCAKSVSSTPTPHPEVL
jgi:hypothetical protein